MKPIAGIVCCCFALAWFNAASAGVETADPASAEVEITNTGQTAPSDGADESVVIGNDGGESVTSDQKIPIVAQPENVDQAKVEQRLEEKAARTRQRISEAKKDVAEREEAARQKQADGATK